MNLKPTLLLTLLFSTVAAFSGSAANPPPATDPDPDTKPIRTIVRPVNPTSTADPLPLPGIERYLGEWVNTDPEAGCVRLVFTMEKQALMMHGWGNCRPTPCDWGAAEATPVAASVNAKANAQPFDFLFGEWKSSFETSYLKLSLTNGPQPQLMVETITVFAGGDDRPAYHLVEIMRKKK